MAAVPLIRHFVWGIGASDPLTYAGVVVVLLAVATAASVTPALRILRLDPATTLRQEEGKAQGSRLKAQGSVKILQRGFRGFA